MFIVGAGNLAGQATVYLSKYASAVSMLVRGGSLAKSMSHYLISQIESHPEVMVLTQSTVVDVTGETSLEVITIADATTGDTRAAPAFALFIFVGAKPHIYWGADAVVR
jgi:thioredoxin reductase (NADPH)